MLAPIREKYLEGLTSRIDDMSETVDREERKFLKSNKNIIS